MTGDNGPTLRVLLLNAKILFRRCGLMTSIEMGGFYLAQNFARDTVQDTAPDKRPPSKSPARGCATA